MNLKIKYIFIFCILTIFTCLIKLNSSNSALSYNESKLIDYQNSISSLLNYIDINNEILSDSLKSDKYPEKIQKSMLIYRFSEDMCDECINQDLKELYNYRKKIGEERILIVPDYMATRINNISFDNKLKHFKYKNITSEYLKFPINKKTGAYQRYFAIINSKGEITSIFFPIKNQQKTTQIYLDHIYKKLN